MSTTDRSARTPVRVFAFSAFIFSLAYDVAQVLDIAGALEAPWGLFAIVLPSLLLAWSWLALVSALHADRAGEGRRWTQLALSFATVYATLNSFVYVVQLAIVVPEALSGGPGLSGPFALADGKALIAVNAMAYALLSISALFLAFSYRSARGARFVRAALIAHGVLAPVILAILYVPALLPLGGLWMLTFPAAAIGILRQD